STYDNSCLMAGPEGVMVVGFTKPELKQYEGKRLSEIASLMHKDWAEVIIDLNVAEEARLGEILFLMNEDNVRSQIRQPWIKWGTDAGSEDPASVPHLIQGWRIWERTLSSFIRKRI